MLTNTIVEICSTPLTTAPRRPSATPVVQRKLWPAYSKRNYLTGPVLILVDRIKSIDAWEKLITSFGNTKLLLENKIISIENVDAFWKISGDEEIGLALATLINTMDESSKFKLENELYYVGCLEKFLSLLGNKREREFVCKGNSSNTPEPREWKRLVDFLNDELIQREKMTFGKK